MPQVVRPISYIEVLDAPNSASLLDEYAKECLVEDPAPQRDLYEAMEKAGIIHSFGAFIDETLVGFASIVVGPMPHHGKRIATIESIFVSSTHRDSGTGNDLLTAVEDCAKEDGCAKLVYNARIGSAMEKVLSRRSGCVATHTMYTRSFQW